MKQVEVVCAGCGKMFAQREAPDHAPPRVHGCCPDCNEKSFKAGEAEEKAKAAEKAKPSPKNPKKTDE